MRFHNGHPRKNPANFRIKVLGFLSSSATDKMEFSISVNEADGRIVTTLSGEVADQAALMGILTYLYDFGFTWLAVEYQSSI
jgi:hypothetical protein